MISNSPQFQWIHCATQNAAYHLVPVLGENWQRIPEIKIISNRRWNKEFGKKSKDGGPILADIQGQAWWVSEQLPLVGDVLAYCSRVGLNDLLMSFPTQWILWFRVVLLKNSYHLFIFLGEVKSSSWQGRKVPPGTVPAKKDGFTLIKEKGKRSHSERQQPFSEFILMKPIPYQLLELGLEFHSAAQLTGWWNKTM